METGQRRNDSGSCYLFAPLLRWLASVSPLIQPTDLYFATFHQPADVNQKINAYIKKALLAVKAAAVILLGNAKCGSHSASMRPNESVEVLNQEASALWH